MFDLIKNFSTILNNFFFIWMRRTLNSMPIIEMLIGLSLIIIRILFNEILEKEYFFRYEAPFYDTGSMMSFLILLEHIYVCYYLIIIIIMVYWFLYLCIIDFSGWTTRNQNSFFNIINKYFKIQNFFNNQALKLIKFNSSLLIIVKEINYLNENLNKKITGNLNDYINNLKKNITKFSNLSEPKLLNNINFTFDILGRTYLIFNQEQIKQWKLINILTEFNNLVKKDFNLLDELNLKKYFNKYLFYTKPKLFDFFYYVNIILYSNNKKNQNKTMNYLIINLRSLYKEIFITNQFKHSGIFEIIWAVFPTFIIICILIPSLILLYSFEDILNPKLSIKVIGNQWYWTYEFDNWTQFKQLNNNNLNKYFFENQDIKNIKIIKNDLKNYLNLIITKFNINWKDINYISRRDERKEVDVNWANFCYNVMEWNTFYKNYNLNDYPIDIKDCFMSENYYKNETLYINNNYKNFYNIKINNSYINKNIYTNYSYNSVIIPQENLIYGTKRLLEVDNRLILPTNITIRLLITSADVLHAYAMPELGFKVDAVPGRLNQILVYINRPLDIYGKCSELCGANHAFMPIVIQSVLPETYLNYLETIQLKSDII